jgi:uncharacterized protein YggT (Ycf19 family)
MDICFINLSFSVSTLVWILIVFHFYLVIRYCVMRIYQSHKDKKLSSSITDLLIVLFIPFIGYYIITK